VQEKNLWKRKCPSCKIELLYCNKYTLAKANNKQSKCLSCALTKEKKEYKIKCKYCGIIMQLFLTETTYKNKLRHSNGYKEYCSFSCSSKSHIRTKEWNKKISESNTGKSFSEEHRRKIGIAGIGRIPWNKGLSKYTDDRLMIISKQNSESTRLQLMQRYGYISYEDYLQKLPTRYRYYTLVRTISEKQPLHLLENFDKPRGRAGKSGMYHLDHMISINYGFKNNIDPKIIGHISNLQFITWQENLQKGVS